MVAAGVERRGRSVVKRDGGVAEGGHWRFRSLGANEVEVDIGGLCRTPHVGAVGSERQPARWLLLSGFVVGGRGRVCSMLAVGGWRSVGWWWWCVGVGVE